MVFNRFSSIKKEGQLMIKVRECQSTVAPDGRVVEWLLVEPYEQKSMQMYLHFYEWDILFDAVRKGQRTRCNQQFSMAVNKDQNQAIITYENIQLICNAALDGVDLFLTITNNTNHDWLEISGIIPCFNPGNSKTENPPVNQLFLDEMHTQTFFLGQKDLELLNNREIHFNEKLHSTIEQFSPDGNFAFSSIWPTSELDAKEGILIRESEDKKWVTGIGWEDFLFVQAHNPLKCMHVCAKVGPLRISETKSIRGKIYLFRGKKDECLSKFFDDFSVTKRS